jgi:hypothetical protein
VDRAREKAAIQKLHTGEQPLDVAAAVSGAWDKFSIVLNTTAFRKGKRFVTFRRSRKGDIAILSA